MPAYNEATIIERSLAELLDGHAVARRAVRDRRRRERLDRRHRARIAARVNPEVRVLHRERADYGDALRQGLLEATGEIVVNFDCDYYDLGFVARAVDRIREPERPATIVVGSKRAPGADDRRRWSRRLVTATFSTMLRVGFGLTVSDTHGMKALLREPLLPVVARCRYGRDLFDTELILRAERAGPRRRRDPGRRRGAPAARTSIVRRIPHDLGLARLWFVLRRDA